MLGDLCPDIILMIFRLLNLNDVINLSECSRFTLGMYKSMCNYEWESICNTEYGVEFWIKARNRNKVISNPLKTYKEEIMRMKEYEASNIKYFNTKILISDYYHLWETLERKLINKK